MVEVELELFCAVVVSTLLEAQEQLYSVFLGIRTATFGYMNFGRVRATVDVVIVNMLLLGRLIQDNNASVTTVTFVLKRHHVFLLRVVTHGPG
jgi:hypothetical protein